MKEYFRIMFTDFDVMDSKDWGKWQRYSNVTFGVSVFIWLILFIIQLGIIIWKF